MFMLIVPSSVRALRGLQRKCLHGQNLFPPLYPTYAMEKTKGKLTSEVWLMKCIWNVNPEVCTHLAQSIPIAFNDHTWWH